MVYSSIFTRWPVVHIVRRRDLQGTGAKVHRYIFIGDDGDAAADEWHKGMLAHEMPVAFIIRMHCDGAVSQDRFGADRGDGDEFGV